MKHRARIIIHCQQDVPPSTYYYTLFTEWRTQHVLLYTVNSMAHQAYWSRRQHNTDFYSPGFRLHSQLRLRTSVSESFQVFLSPSRNSLGLYQPSLQEHFLKHHFQLIIHSHPITWCCVSPSLFKQINRMTKQKHQFGEKTDYSEDRVLINILCCPVTMTNIYLHSFRNVPRNYKNAT